MLRYGIENEDRRSSLFPGWSVWLGILTMVAWCVAAAGWGWLPAAAAQTRRILPPDDEWQFAEQTLREQYAVQIEDARREQRETLVKTWLISSQSQSEPATRYALLMMARQTALEIGSVDLVFQAMDQLHTDFFLDYVTHIAPVAVELPKHVAPQASRSVVQRLEAVIRRAVDADQYQVALQLSDAALAAARDASDAQLTSRVVDARRQIEQLHEQFDLCRDSAERLNNDPLNPQANQQIGVFRCVIKQDWQRGLPMLALGQDPALRQLAIAELRPTSTQLDQQVQLGDGWWQLAEQGEPHWQAAAQQRSAFWYRQTLDQLPLAERTRVESRLDQLAAAMMKDARLPPGPMLLMTFDKGTFTPRAGGILVKDLSGNGNLGMVAGPSQVPGIVGEALGFDGRDDFVEIPNRPGKGSAEGLTICVWVNVQQWTGNGDSDFVSKDDWQSGPRGYVLRARRQFPDFTYSGGNWQTVASTTSIELNRWYHLASVYDGVEIKVYVDGLLRGRTAAVEPIQPSPLNLRLGRGAFDKRRGLNGMLDELVIYSRPLTDDEIHLIYQMGKLGQRLEL